MGYHESPAERAIREAMEQGAFDNLPGKGKPIPPENDALTPPELRLMHKILRNADVQPEWVQRQQDIHRRRAEVETLFARAEREYPARHTRVMAPGMRLEERQHAFAAWHADARDAYETLLKRVNSDILTLNIQSPAGTPPSVPFRMEEEMARYDTAFPALPGVTADRRKESEKKDPADVLQNALAVRWSRREG